MSVTPESAGEGHSSMHDVREVLRERFGYDAFRAGQRELVDAIMARRDCVGIMPTGAGKSICYQVPALALDGLTLVISPLVSLMSDQVMALRALGVSAAYLNSRLSPTQQDEVIHRAHAGAYDLMYVAPERLDDARFLSLVTDPAVPLPLVAVDEAHCVSQWGQDFRPSYLGIRDFIESLPTRPTVAAFTATATPRVADDIMRLLGLHEPVRVTTGFDRPNLRFEVEQLADAKKIARIAAYALNHAGDSGIIYCSTRKDTERVHEALVAAGVPATRYHAGLGHGERETNQRLFVNDDAPVMVATNAFGMGIDKSNVRYVIHHNMPGSLEAYYQEAGRAGRDGEPADCLLMWNDADIATCRFFIEQETNNEALTPEEQQAVRASQRRRLAAMANYCMTTACLRQTILRYFGDEAGEFRPAVAEEGDVREGSDRADADRGCGNCSNCDGVMDVVDVTVTARSVMRCVHELRGRFGKGIVADVLTGSRQAKILEWGLDRSRTYGIVDDSTATVKEIIELLTAGEYLEISEGRYPIVGLGPRAREAATDEFRLYMKRRKKREAPGKAPGSRARSSHAGETLQTEAQRALFERLRALRKQIADGEGVPPYVVFSDAALRGMCVALPRSDAEFLAVSGVGPVKLERYGRVFMDEIASSI